MRRADRPGTLSAARAARPRRSPELTLLRLGAAVAGVVPGGAARAVAETVGILAGRVPAGTGRVGAALASRRALVASHLRRVHGGEVDRRWLEGRVDDVFASYARYWAESLRLPSLGTAEVAAGMSFQGLDLLDGALAGGRGVVLALPHLGGWEWGGTYLAGSGYRASVVVEALEPPELLEWFAAFRRRLGLEVIVVGPDAGRACLAALRDNRVLCLLSDRLVGSVPGVDVELFGAPTRLPAGPVTLALRTGAPLLPTAVYFGRAASEHLAVIRPPLALPRSGRGLRADVSAGTQALAAELEALIRRAPTQWHLMAPHWPGDEALARH